MQGCLWEVRRIRLVAAFGSAPARNAVRNDAGMDTRPFASNRF